MILKVMRMRRYPTSTSLVQNSPSHHHTRLPRSLPPPRTFPQHRLICRPSRWMLFNCYRHSYRHHLLHLIWVQSFGRGCIIARQRRPRWSALILATPNPASSECSSTLCPTPTSLSLLITLRDGFSAVYLFTNIICLALEAPDAVVAVQRSFLLPHFFTVVMLPLSVSNCVVLLIFPPHPSSFFSPFT